MIWHQVPWNVRDDCLNHQYEISKHISEWWRLPRHPSVLTVCVYIMFEIADANGAQHSCGTCGPASADAREVSWRQHGGRETVVRNNDPSSKTKLKLIVKVLPAANKQCRQWRRINAAGR